MVEDVTRDLTETLRVETRTLSSGMRVVLAPCEAESVAVGLFVASGSRHETAKTAGISHFIEHMLFKGTPTRTPLQITQAIEGRGGNFNAFTGEEATCYYTHMPDEYLGESIDILSDMYLNASIPEDEFRREKGVVIEEIRMYADEPDSVAMENLQRSLFPGSQLGAPVAGSEKSLAPMEPGDLRRYIRSHYRADNTIAVIVGNFDKEKAFSLVARAFASLKSSKPQSHSNSSPRLKKRPKPSPSWVSVGKDVQQTQIALGYRTFGIGDRRRYAAAVFDAVMGRGMSSRLFQSVRERRGLSYDISSRMQFFTDAGMWTVTAGVAPDKAESALATIDRELARIRERKVSAAELRRTKDFLTGNFKLSHERVTSKLFFYGQTLLSFGRPVMPEEQVAGIRAVTADDILAVARSILSPTMRAVSLVTPKGDSIRGVPQSGDCNRNL